MSKGTPKQRKYLKKLIEKSEQNEVPRETRSERALERLRFSLLHYLCSCYRRRDYNPERARNYLLHTDQCMYRAFWRFHNERQTPVSAVIVQPSHQSEPLDLQSVKPLGNA